MTYFMFLLYNYIGDIMYRNTYAEINLENIKYNIKTIIDKYNSYKYYIGVVKADSYGHNTNKVVKSIIDGGVNYLAVSSLEEALEIRKEFDIPILCLGLINYKYMNIVEKNNIDITVDSLEYFEKIKNYNINIHLKIDTGMNRLGIKNSAEFDNIINRLDGSKVYLKGIYTHIYNACNKQDTMNQITKFKLITHNIDLNKIDIVHIAQSDTLINYDKIDFCNGCRLGIIMYGLNNNNLNLKNTFKLVSEVIEIKKVKKGETIGYNGSYKCANDELIAIVSIGYADGINRHLTGSYVYIDSNKYKIIGNICMDMLMVKVDKKVKVNDLVYIYKDIDHIKYLSSYLDTIPYELICNISKRVPRVYK